MKAFIIELYCHCLYISIINTLAIQKVGEDEVSLPIWERIWIISFLVYCKIGTNVAILQYAHKADKM